MYPFFDTVAPIIRAMSRATLGFSAMQTIIVLAVFCFYTTFIMNRHYGGNAMPERPSVSQILTYEHHRVATAR